MSIARLLPLLAAAFFAVAAPAVAQTTGTDGSDPTSGYTDTTPPPTTPAPEPAPEPEPEPTPAPDDTGVEAERAAGGDNPAPASSAAPATTASAPAPTQLAYTGAEPWLVGLVGLLALSGALVLVRSTRRA